MSNISTYGFDKFEKRLMKLAQETPGAIDKQVSKLQMMLLADVKQATRVKSGILKRSWTTSKVQNGKGEVGTNIEYAPHVEKGFNHKTGGYKVKGYHMVEKSMQQLDKRLPDEMNRFFDEIAGDMKL